MRVAFYPTQTQPSGHSHKLRQEPWTVKEGILQVPGVVQGGGINIPSFLHSFIPYPHTAGADIWISS